MKIFACDHCGQPLYFENYVCGNCGRQLGFEPSSMEFISIAGNNLPPDRKIGAYRFCFNRTYHVCNWLTPANETDEFCIACQLNRTIPNLSDESYRQRWHALELAKHRLVYSMLRLSLPVVSKAKDADYGLFFDFKADETNKVITGHANGIITINISEADDIEREMARRNLEEVYRTVLGHFRHEVGHYYWDLLVRNGVLYNEFRALFGDETADYGQALKTYYDYGAPARWNERFISAYASAHPWEDWAESWAHYLHIVDTLETAYAYGVSLSPVIRYDRNEFQLAIDRDPYTIAGFDHILHQWIYFSVVLNNLNRSMGLKDAYPFVIHPPVADKLKFVHKVVHAFTRT